MNRQVICPTLSVLSAHHTPSQFSPLSALLVLLPQQLHYLLIMGPFPNVEEKNVAMLDPEG